MLFHVRVLRMYRFWYPQESQDKPLQITMRDDYIETEEQSSFYVTNINIIGIIMESYDEGR